MYVSYFDESRITYILYEQGPKVRGSTIVHLWKWAFGIGHRSAKMAPLPRRSFLYYQDRLTDP